jgi:predicted lipid carrier protein YhbT
VPGGTVAYLSDEWLEVLWSVASALPARPGATARVQYVVSGAPDGERRYAVSVVDGRVEEVTLGDDPGAEVTLTETYPDARQIAEGELDASAAFMQGRIKVVGDMGKVMALMPFTQSAEYRDALAELSRQTAY